MMKNYPPRNRGLLWMWRGRVECYPSPCDAPRWVLNCGLLRKPCVGCERSIMKREWYMRHPTLGPICRDCFGSDGLPEAGSRGCRGQSPLR